MPGINRSVMWGEVQSSHSHMIEGSYSSLKKSVLDNFEHNPYSSINKSSMLTVFFFEMLAMFIFVFGMTCFETEMETDILTLVSACIAMSISARLSAANISLSVTLSHILRKENKYQPKMLIPYLGSQILGSLLALIMAEILNDRSLAPYVPDDESLLGCTRVVLAELIGTFLLVFFILQISNPNTTFIENELSAFMFISMFIYIGKRFAPASKKSINIAVTLSCAILEASKGHLESLNYCVLWVAGDIMGAVLATIFYDRFFQPNVEHVRNMKINSQYFSIIRYNSRSELGDIDINSFKSNESGSDYQQKMDEPGLHQE